MWISDDPCSFPPGPTEVLRGLTVAIIGFLVLACSDAQPQAQTATGVVIQVAGTTPADIDRFTLRTDDGTVLELVVGTLESGAETFPAAHLREHQSSAEPIRVTYKAEGEGLVAVRLEDAPDASDVASPSASGVPSSSASGVPSPSVRTSREPSPPTSGQPGATTSGATAIELVPFAEGFDSPVFLTHAGDGTGATYVVEQVGRIQRLDASGQREAEPFLDLTDRVRAGGERGFLGLAFHPDYPENGRFFVHYTDQRGDGIIAEFGRGPDGAGDPASERMLVRFEDPYPNHNGGMLAFGPDGVLYASQGDGGSAGDPENRAQDPESLFGKLLRLDVDDPRARPERWAIGLRNPWRFSFDRETGALWIGDVGQGEQEEIDYLAPDAPGGANLGWRVVEGDACFEDPGCDLAAYVPPVATYSHEFGCSVTGGYVYRGEAEPALRGTYFFADYCSGLIWGLDAAEAGAGAVPVRYDLLLESGLSVSSFGENEAGELFLTDLTGGSVYVVTAP